MNMSIKNGTYVQISQIGTAFEINSSKPQS